jgi:MFS superfamily sulfate permease-like transporter
VAERLGRVAPGLSALLHYRIAENLQYDFVAGLSVAAVALPVSVAYAELAGFNPVVGLYSSILPLVAYAVFGTSRQLIVNPDAATCAMIAAAVAPDAAGNAELYLSLSITLTFFTGLICIVARDHLRFSPGSFVLSPASSALVPSPISCQSRFLLGS